MIEPQEGLPSAGKALALVVVSVVSGMFFGLLAGAGAGMSGVAMACGLVGAVVGALCSPIFAWGMWHDEGGGVSAVLVVTALVALLAGFATPANGAPFLAMIASVAVYAGLSVAIGVRTRRVRRRLDRSRCTMCGYVLTGLTGSVCPECGTAFVSKPDCES